VSVSTELRACDIDHRCPYPLYCDAVQFVLLSAVSLQNSDTDAKRFCINSTIGHRSPAVLNGPRLRTVMKYRTSLVNRSSIVCPISGLRRSDIYRLCWWRCGATLLVPGKSLYIGSHNWLALFTSFTFNCLTSHQRRDLVIVWFWVCKAVIILTTFEKCFCSSLFIWFQCNGYTCLDLFSLCW
jgi:hypothetical protein